MFNKRFEVNKHWQLRLSPT